MYKFHCLPSAFVAAEDVGAWPYSVGIVYFSWYSAFASYRVYFGTAGFLYFLELMVIPLGQRLVLRVLVTRLLFEWSLPGGFDADDADLRLPDNPNV